MSRYQEVNQIVVAEFAKSGLCPTEYGIQQATEECVFFEDSQGRNPVDQMHYILNQAIPDGEREGWVIVPSVLDMGSLDKNLRADVTDQELAEAELYQVYAGATDETSDAGWWQILWMPSAGRAGLVYVGSGSNGSSIWTDAKSPSDAYSRLLRDEISA